MDTKAHSPALIVVPSCHSAPCCAFWHPHCVGYCRAPYRSGGGSAKRGGMCGWWYGGGRGVVNVVGMVAGDR